MIERGGTLRERYRRTKIRIEDRLSVPAVIAMITDLVSHGISSLGLNSRWPSKTSQKEYAVFE
jgi:hypothetical protein